MARKKKPSHKPSTVVLRAEGKILDVMAADDVTEDGERPDRSALLRRLIREEKARRDASQKGTGA
jgi:hypothetical protein